MVGALPELTLREKVLLWLSHVEGRGDDDPAARTQAGLAQATGLDRGHVSRTVAPLVTAGLVREERARVPGFARTLKAYALTKEGAAEAARLEASILDADVDVRQGSAAPVRTRAADAVLRLPRGAGVFGLMQQLQAHGHVQLETGGVQAPRARYVREWSDAPVESTFVGRSRETSQLQAWLAGPAAVFAVEGPGGVGKSTLVAHALRRAELRRHVVWVRIEGWTTLDGVSSHVAAFLLALGRSVGEAFPHDDAAAWAGAAEARLRGVPVVLVFDDVHKATALVADAIMGLARRAKAAAPVKVVLIGRELHLPGALAREAEKRRLHPLSDQEADDLLGGLGVEHAERARIISAGRGNPLFLEILAQSGDSEGSAGAVRQDFLHFLSQDLVRDLPAALVDLLSWTAALRAPAESGLYDRLGVGSPAGLLTLVQASLLKQREDGRYEMHDLVRAALYDRLDFSERRRRHGRLAEALRPTGRDPTRDDWSNVAEFLHHLVQAGRRDEAVRWVLRNQTPLMARARALFDAAPRPATGRTAAQ